jgi:hypothetical protein
MCIYKYRLGNHFFLFEVIEHADFLSMTDCLIKQYIYSPLEIELAEVNSMCVDAPYCSTCVCKYWMNAHMHSFLFFQGFVSCAALTNCATGRAFLSERLASYTRIYSLLLSFLALSGTVFN